MTQDYAQAHICVVDHIFIESVILPLFYVLLNVAGSYGLLKNIIHIKLYKNSE